MQQVIREAAANQHRHVDARKLRHPRFPPVIEFWSAQRLRVQILGGASGFIGDLPPHRKEAAITHPTWLGEIAIDIRKALPWADRRQMRWLLRCSSILRQR